MLQKIENSLLFLLILAILINANQIKSPAGGLILGFIYFLVFGFLLGKIIFKDKNNTWQLFMGMFSLFSIYSLAGAIIYYLYQLNFLSFDILFTLVSITILALNLKSKNQGLKLKNFINGFIKAYSASFKSIQTLILTATYLIFFIISLYILFTGQTAEAIRSPWQVIPSYFFIIYFLATINLILLFFHGKKFISNILLTFHFFLTTSIALIIYKLGYGFDPFVHRVTETAIWQNGFILPKTLYYLGQYSLVVFLTNLTQLPLAWIDKLLLPILLSIFLPYFIFKSLAETFAWPKKFCRTLTLIFLCLPFALLIATTPQALANIFSIIILFLSFLYLKNRQISFYYLVFSTFTALAIHPLAGIPILIYLIIAWLIKNKNSANKIILIIFSLLSAGALPLALLFNSIISINKVSISADKFSLIEWPTIFSRQFNYFLDIAYLYKYSIYWIFLIVAIITFVYLLKQKKAEIFLASILTFIILIINAILLNFIKVSLIIDYEQADFSQRVWQLAFYFLLPIVIYGFYLFMTKSVLQKSTYIFTVILLASFLTGSLYLSYPRFDDYGNSKFVNLSQADLDAVQFIEKNSQDKDYIVITDQMTSVAALKIFGFTRYYNGQYFYPIPTGGLL